MFCPNCHAEYREGFYRCADCKVPLVNSLGSAPMHDPRADLLESSQEDSVALLWRGEDPVLYTSLVTALEEAHIPYCETPMRDFKARFSAVNPRFSDSAPGFEVRVLNSQLAAAEDLLESLLDQEPGEGPFDVPETSATSGEPTKREIPEVWNPDEASAQVWSGHDETIAQFLLDAFRANGIPGRLVSEALGVLRLLVVPNDEPCAREIVCQVTEGVPPQ